MNQENTTWRQHDLFRGIILFGIALLLFDFIITGNIKYYISPKMIVFSAIAMIILFLLSVMHLLRSCSDRETIDINCDCGVDHQAGSRPWLKIIVYSVFILPVLCGFTFPHKFLDSAVAENRGVQLNFNTALTTSSKVTEKPQNANRAVTVDDSTTLDSKAPEQIMNTNNSKPVDASPLESVPPAQQKTNKSPEEVFKEARFGEGEANAALYLYKQPVIRITDETYIANLSTINLYLDQFIGKKLELTGFIYRDPSMKKDETVVARFAVACCTADANVFGVDVKGDKVNTYAKDTWVKVQGTIDQMESEGIMVPMLRVDKIEKVKAPEDPYVY